jgi:hypothetical protein
VEREEDEWMGVKSFAFPSVKSIIEGVDEEVKVSPVSESGGIRLLVVVANELSEEEEDIDEVEVIVLAEDEEEIAEPRPNEDGRENVSVEPGWKLGLKVGIGSRAGDDDESAGVEEEDAEEGAVTDNEVNVIDEEFEDEELDNIDEEANRGLEAEGEGKSRVEGGEVKVDEREVIIDEELIGCGDRNR